MNLSLPLLSLPFTALLVAGLLPTQEEASSPPGLRALGRTICFARPFLLAPSPVRLVDRIDIDRTIRGIQAARVDSYVFHLEADRNRLPELREFLPAAQAKGISVWVRILPPTLGANMKPHLGDYQAWAKTLARLGAKHENLVAVYIPDLDFGRNRRFLNAHTLGAMRRVLNPVHVRLVAGVFDPTPQFWKQMEQELDGIVCTWVQAKELRNLSTFLQGSRALTPKSIPVIAGYPCQGLAPGKHVMTPEVMTYAIRQALHQVDGVFLRDFVLRSPSNTATDRKRFEAASKIFLQQKQR